MLFTVLGGGQAFLSVSSNGTLAFLLPRWSADGRALHYLQDDYIVRHEIRLGPPFVKGAAIRLFATKAQDFDVVPGGRFILSELSQEPPDAPLQVILNWFEELKGKVR